MHLIFSIATNRKIIKWNAHDMFYECCCSISSQYVDAYKLIYELYPSELELKE